MESQNEEMAKIGLKEEINKLGKGNEQLEALIKFAKQNPQDLFSSLDKQKFKLST
jgi:hypothetical protein